METNPFQDLDDTEIAGETQESESPSDTALDSLDITTTVDESQEVGQTPGLNFEIPETDNSALDDLTPESTDPQDFQESPELSAAYVDQDFPPNQFEESSFEGLDSLSSSEIPDNQDDLSDVDMEAADVSDDFSDPENLSAPDDQDALPNLEDKDSSDSLGDMGDIETTQVSVSPLPPMSFGESAPRSIPASGYKTAGTYLGY